MKDQQHLKKDFHRACKIKKPVYNTLRVWTKNEENFEKFQETFRFFDQNLYGKWNFSHFLLNISWISDSSPKVYTSGR